MPDIDARKGQAPPAHTREEFSKRFRARFFDPAFRGEDEAIARLEEIAWQGYCGARKSPVTRKAGPGFADPDFELSVEWLDTRNKLIAAQQRWGDAATPSRVLVINATARRATTAPARARCPRASGWRRSHGRRSQAAGCRSTCWT